MTDREKREKAFKGLKCLIRDTCDGCPNYTDRNCPEDMTPCRWWSLTRSRTKGAGTTASAVRGGDSDGNKPCGHPHETV